MGHCLTRQRPSRDSSEGGPSSGGPRGCRGGGWPPPWASRSSRCPSGAGALCSLKHGARKRTTQELQGEEVLARPTQVLSAVFLASRR